MISKTEYEVLSLIKNKTKIDTKKYKNVLNSLLNDNLICLSNDTMVNIRERVYHGCYITSKGNRAFEEYYNSINVKRRANLALFFSVLGLSISLASFIVEICR